MRERCNTNTRHPKMYLKFFRKVQRFYRRYHFSIIKIFPSLDSTQVWNSSLASRELVRKSMSFHGFFFSFLQLLGLLMQVFSKTPKICSCKRPTETCLGFFNNLSLGFCTMQTHTHTGTGAAFTSLRHITEILPRAFSNN